MGSIARKVLTESVGQAVVTMAAASSSTPSPFLNEDGSYLTSPFSTSPGLKPITAIVIVFLFVAFFLVGFFSIHFQRCCYTHGARIGDSDSPPTVMQGLDLSILETLPKVIFSSSSASVQPRTKGRSKKEMTECAICLEEFSEHETLRLLPHCGHTFHLDCINVWLSSHTTCPLCRRSLLPSKPDPDTIAIGVAYLNGAIVIGEERPRNNGAAAMMDAASSIASGALQRRAPEDPENPGEEGGELSGDRAEIQRSHSMGYDHRSSLAKGEPPAASSSPSLPLLLFFIAHRSSSCTALLNLSAASESETTETNPPRRKEKKRERRGFSAAMGGLSDGEFSPSSSAAAPPSSSSSSRS